MKTNKHGKMASVPYNGGLCKHVLSCLCGGKELVDVQGSDLDLEI